MGCFESNGGKRSGGSSRPSAEGQRFQGLRQTAHRVPELEKTGLGRVSFLRRYGRFTGAERSQALSVRFGPNENADEALWISAAAMPPAARSSG